jgi:hypothetical protein
MGRSIRQKRFANGIHRVETRFAIDGASRENKRPRNMQEHPEKYDLFFGWDTRTVSSTLVTTVGRKQL